MKRILYIAILLSALGCQRYELPPVPQGEPLFRASGTLDGTPFNIAAGVDGFVLDATFDRNEAGVYEYVAHFHKDGFPDALKISIMDDERVLPVQNVNVDEALAIGEYALHTEPVLIDHDRLQFYSLSADRQYTWTINGAVSEEAYPIVDLGMAEMEAELTLYDGEGCYDEITQEIDQFDTLTYAAYHYRPFKVERGSEPGRIYFSLDGDLNDVSDISWQITGNGEPIVSETFAYNHLFAEPGVYNVKMTVSLNNGSYSYRYQENIDPFDADNGCVASIRFEPTPVNLSQNDLSRVRIDYTAPNGEQYSSYSKTVEEDVSGSSFEIIDVVEYGNNPQGFQTRQLEVLINCKLYKVNNPSPEDYIELTDFGGTIAVAFPG